MLIAADYWINTCCQSKGTSRVSPHTLRLVPATPWCDWRSSFIVIRNERVCWENCLWWLRRIIFNTLQVSNKQMKRTLQIITNVLACLKCMLWLPVIVFFLCSCTSPSFYFSLSHGSVLPHSFHIPPTYSLFPSKSPAGVHACVFMRLLVCVCVCSSRGLFSSSPWLHIACFYHDCGQLHILSPLRASKNPLRRIRKQRSVHSGLVPRSLQWGGNGISMHTVTPAAFQSRALDELQPHMWSSTGWVAFSFGGSVCVVERNGELAKCAFETFHPLPLFSAVT